MTTALFALLLGQDLFHDPAQYHLGVEGKPEWEEFAGKTPHGTELKLTFKVAARPKSACTLLLRQENVKHSWDVTLNGRKLARLVNQEDALVLALDVPAGTLRDGENTLAVVPRSKKRLDDVLIGPIRIDPRTRDGALGGATIEVEVNMPCRITIAEPDGTLAALLPSPGQRLAVRPGVIYAGVGRTRFTVVPGRYTLYATRGFEYGLDQSQITVAAGDVRKIKLSLTREVTTTGWVACDTHIHTRELSGHGDATLEERMLTLAGEGIELPISTEHNQHADYSKAAVAAKVDRHFTTVIGNEVTTKTGHFNIWPVKAGSPTPDAKLTDWPKLMESIRAVPGVRVIILNHPCDVHGGFTPFASENMNLVTGENHRGPEFTFNGVELVNSGALRSDLMETYRRWFALLNHGYRITGAGSSDSHDVSRSVVGQGRTYLACSDGDPASIDVETAAKSFVEGRALVSMGLLTTIRVNGRFGPGDLATKLGAVVEVEVAVLGPSWTKVDRVELYANGVKIREERPTDEGRAGEKFRKTWRLPRSSHDVHLVAVATGPGVRKPYWSTPRPYQASDRNWNPRVIGSTNPVWLDSDGDAAFTPARGYAKRLVKRHGADSADLLHALDSHDEAVATHAASLCRWAGKDLRNKALQAALMKASKPVRRGFAAYAATFIK